MKKILIPASLVVLCGALLACSQESAPPIPGFPGVAPGQPMPGQPVPGQPMPGMPAAAPVPQPGMPAAAPAPQPAAPAAAGALTGEVGVARLKAKGWQFLTEPTIVDQGSARTTTAISAPPNTATILIMEYKSAMIGQAAFNAMKASDPAGNAMVGNTIITVSGAKPELKAKAMQDIMNP